MPPKKPSAASWPPDLVLLLDRCMGAKTVPDALRAEGANVLCHQDHFAHDAPDEQWLKEAGQRGWVVITKDRRIRSRSAEKDAIIDSGALAFLVVSANVGGAALAEIVRRALPSIRQLAIDGKSGQMYLIGRTGKPTRVR